MKRYEAVHTILLNKEVLCNRVIEKVNEQRLLGKEDTEKCIRDLRLIIDAISNDVLNGTTSNITRAGFGYIYYHNGLTFNKQRTQVIYAIEILRQILLDELEADDQLRFLINLKFDLLLSIISDSTMQTVKWWDFAARVLPMAALGLMFWIEVIGYDSFYHYALITIASVFFATAVGWWWWALRKIGAIFITLKRAQERFFEVQKELKNVTTEVSNLKKGSTKSVDKSE